MLTVAFYFACAIKNNIGMDMKKLLFFAVLTLLSVKPVLYAQEADTLNAKIEELKSALNGLTETYLETKTTVDALKKIKLSGYIQAQFQSAESDAAASYAGGNFSTGVHNRMLVRRGRIKINYDNDLTQYVLQLDATEKSVGIKDAYVSVKEPWLRTFGLTAGVFDRPFGFEISYSSSSRETPERSRLFQTLFPGERDLGFKLEMNAPDGPLSFLNFKGGVFAGNGINVETDNNKDIIGRIGFQLPFYDINMAIDGGVSGYFGNVTMASGKSLYTVDSPEAATTSTGVKDVERKYIGADLQLYYDLPVLGGFSLRGEYIVGKQPGTSSASGSYTAAPTADIYLRNFSGYYINYIQNLGDSWQFVLKYDVYDPNTDVSGDEIGANPAAKLSAGDLKYSTLGLGLVYYYDANVKFTFYYDSVKNETSSKLTGYTDDLKDNVFTFRVQYKF